MSIAPRQIGWSQKANLLWEISRQLDRINSVVCTGPCPTTTSTTTATLTTTTSTTTLPPTTTTTSSSSTTTTTTTLAIPNVVIGTQRWSTINLDVTTYRDGTPIPEVTDPTEWENLTTGAWCYYDNDPANGPVYGKLYNWYAVSNIANGGLAPVGQHIPTDPEWTTLTTYLGGELIAGGKLKSTGISLWLSPNTGATNESGFTGLPAGNRSFFGSFFGIGQNALFWSSTENGASIAWYRVLSNININMGRGSFNKYVGFSVRCIID
jgi:uncharacterized protein (TIGR02145 family)